MAFPLNVFPCRYTIETMMKHGGYRTNNCWHVVLTVLISGGALLTSLYVKEINLVFQLMGGTASAFVCFCLPAAFAIKTRVVAHSRVQTIGAWALCVGGGILGAVSTGLTIYSAVAASGVTAKVCPKIPHH
jgi:hypothetical protein